MCKLIILSFLSVMLSTSCQKKESDKSTLPKKQVAEEGNEKGDEIDLGKVDVSNPDYKKSVRSFKKKQILKDSLASSETMNSVSGAANSVPITNQPLYVIDGVPMDNSRRASAGSWGEKEYKILSDISPEERESVKILTGGKATELYGARGKNGVIIITTKNGKQEDISYIKSSKDTIYTKDDAASLGMQELMKQQKKTKKDN